MVLVSRPEIIYLNNKFLFQDLFTKFRKIKIQDLNNIFLVIYSQLVSIKDRLMSKLILFSR